jgi:mannose-6-phosphate isomerase-like protein (cupin superfamily)
MPRAQVTVQEAVKARVEPGHLSALLLQHGSMQLRWYAPKHMDSQTPHDRDELYIVAAGSAVFVRAEQAVPFGEDNGIDLNGSERFPVKAGDALFVAAGTQHRFETMSPDFGTWMIFYGPEGGEPSVLASPAPLPFLSGAGGGSPDSALGQHSG